MSERPVAADGSQSAGGSEVISSCGWTWVLDADRKGSTALRWTTLRNDRHHWRHRQGWQALTTPKVTSICTKPSLSHVIYPSGGTLHCGRPA